MPRTWRVVGMASDRTRLIIRQTADHAVRIGPALVRVRRAASGSMEIIVEAPGDILVCRERIDLMEEASDAGSRQDAR